MGSDGNLLYTAGKYLNRITLEFEPIYIKYLNTFKYSIKVYEDEILALGRGQLTKLNNELEVVWNYNHGGIYDNDVLKTTDGYLLTRDQRLVKLDNDGDELWEYELQGEPTTMDETVKGSKIISGSYNYNNIYFAKADPDGRIYQIELLAPEPDEEIYMLSDYTINWFSTNISRLDIFVSYDGGEWQLIEGDIEASAERYTWEVPGITASECFLKIQSASNPQLYAVNDTAFSILEGYTGYEFIDINEIKMWIGNNGDGSHDPITNSGGFYWPGDGDATVSAIFDDGLIYGGVVDGEIRFNGNTHREGLQPGVILDGGNADSVDQELYRVYKIKRNWEELPPGIIRDNYENDYINWPGQFGAPYIDVDEDGEFTQSIDEPDFIGDEVLFYVANDLDTAVTEFTYGSLPMGLEFQTTTWGYDTNDFLKDVVFKKYLVINKGDNEISDMILSYWADDDLGYPGDDYVGCDTLMDLGFTYNADEYDEDYYSPPPAVGHMLIQGPIVTSPGDSAFFKGKWISDYKNLSITAFAFYINSASSYRDPQQGIYEGTLEFYNYQQGLVWDGEPYIDPNTSQETVFPLAGDPVEGTGWYEGDGWQGGPNPLDRRFLISAGKFSLSPGDTQEVVIAIHAAKGTDRLNSVTKLKEHAQQIREFYYSGMVVNVDDENSSVPNEFTLYQNYPNPFNPATTIEFSIPNVEPVYSSESTQSVDRRGKLDLSRSNMSELKSALQTKLIVYDVLGREVKTLINQPMKPGRHKIEFDASGLASGVYFYQLKTGEFRETKKMILLR
ncbi:MAG: T9SS type A sorting domain-containing protein [Melioribacteraceae bacterium]|nr:T9SS type A sorting domain-containing protein [Melioribacteraceae bacterium]MCF8356200.1 T9SS type A sorting domain-containing protein [Melioribacteraceae bacterium]MCF8396494.1 T9SS type A sorting domain-containing protein [Melioribacteraceae bacterium]MCF8420053.1 T9SS type A sorting domain-containing protein [Melioribacteraceae bacterium]